MVRPIAVLLLLGWAGAGVAQTTAKKDAKSTNEVEVKFGDGSTVRMVILQETVDIVTKFGKLTVPMTEVRKVELGIHLADGVPDKIQTAMKKLSSEIFKERDEAVNQLVEMGPAAYPTLHAASKSKDPEVSQRVQMALKRIKAKYPADSLRLVVHDRIVTNDFPIVGRIISPTIKAQTPIFGALDLKLNELRTILWMGGNTETEVMVDAAKYCHATTWMDTGVTIESGVSLQIDASGEVDLLPGNGGGQFISGPEGNFNVRGRGPGNRQPGQLLGKIGDSGPVFFIGRSHNTTPTVEGKLYLQITPGPWGNQPAQGAYKVKINAGLR